MGAGKTYRMGRIFGADGRTLVLPVDHGLTLGRVEGLEDPVGRLDDLLDLPCDGLLMTPGLTRLCQPGAEYFPGRRRSCAVG